MQSLRPVERYQLTEWASKQNLWLDAEAFTARWHEGGEIEGGEHQVYEANGVVYKRNNLL